MQNTAKINITVKDFIWNGLGSILTLAMNIFLLPVLLKILPSVDLGLWYVFTSISSLITLLDFGFSPTISRNVTCAWCGAQDLQKEGLTTITSDRNINFLLLKSLLVISRKIYKWISLISMLLLLSCGTLYMYSLISKYHNNIYYLSAWVIYSFSIIVNMYFSYWNAFLRGIGEFKKLNIATIISRSTFIVLSVIGLMFHGGLIAIAISQIISGILLRMLCKKSFVKLVGKEFFSKRMNSTYNEKLILQQLMPNTTKYGVVSIGTFFMQKADTLLCSTFLGLEITSRYGLVMQLFSILGSISQLLFSSYSPQITAERINKNYKKLISIFSIAVVYQFIIGFLGILSIALIGPWALNLIHASSSLLDTYLIVLLGFVLIFEWNTSVFLNFIMTSNKVPFAKSSIISGFLMVFVSYVLVDYTNMGVLALILGRAIVSFSFINWYWPKYVCNELQVKFHKLIASGLFEICKKSTMVFDKLLRL